MDKVLFYMASMRGNAVRLAVPAAAQLKLIEEAHAESPAGHFAPRSVYNSLSKRYYWERMYSDVHIVDALSVLHMVGPDKDRKLPSNQFQFLAPLRELVLRLCKCHKWSVGIDM